MNIITINKLYIYCRKSCDNVGLSIGAQLETIRLALQRYNINIDLVAHRFSSTGSAYNSRKSLMDLLLNINGRKNLIICVSDISRLTRNLSFFNDIIEEFQRLNISIYASNINKLFNTNNPLDITSIKRYIKIVENESKLKSEMSLIKSNERKILLQQRNKNLPINKIFNTKTGKIDILPIGYYRNDTTSFKRKIPEGYCISNNKKELIPSYIIESNKKRKFSFDSSSSSSSSNEEEEEEDEEDEEDEEEEEQILGILGQEFTDENYTLYLKILFKMLITKNAPLSAIKYYLIYLSKFPQQHTRYSNDSDYSITKILSVKHSFSKKNKKCGKQWKSEYSKFVIMPYSLNFYEIDSTFSYYGIYYKNDLTKWSMANIEKWYFELKDQNFNKQDILNIEGCPTYDQFLEDDIRKSITSMML